MDESLRDLERERAREQLLAVARLPADQVDLCEAALWIAAEARPPLPVAHYLERVDRLAERARRALAGTAGAAQHAARLIDFLYREEGFEGNSDDYYDARNSYFDQVLERRTGIPITLAILWIGVARRLDLNAAGVAFPGHFLARLDAPGEPAVLVDAFHGRVVGTPECEELLQRALGQPTQFDERLARPAPPREILARVLRNLKQIHVRTEAFEAALRCSEGILALQPEDPLELRDRGLLYRALECYGPALRDLERFVALLPDGEAAESLRPVLADLRRRVRKLH